MTTLAKRRNEGTEVSTRRNRLLTPSLSTWMDDFFESGLGTGFLSNFNTGMTLPAVNIRETKDEYFLEIAVPGMEKSDFDIDIDNKVLSISSEKEQRNEENDGNYTRREFGYSSFKRNFTLPDSIESDDIQAQYKDGILSIHLPKREEAKEKPAKRINVS